MPDQFSLSTPRYLYALFFFSVIHAGIGLEAITERYVYEVGER